MQQNLENNTKIVNGEKKDNGVVAIRAEEFSGPLPHPEILEHYNRVVPGAAERILSKFEKQTDHRIKIEETIISVASWKELLGLLFGFIIAMTSIIGGIYTALEGKPWLGGSLTFAGLALIVGAFVVGKFSKEK